MKLTLANVREIKRHSDSLLTKAVCNFVIRRWHDYMNKERIFTDVLSHGCQSGCVSELIYTNDIMAFYEKYHKDIQHILMKAMREVDTYNPKDILREWNESDMVAEESDNQTLLTWFSFEETLWRIAQCFDSLCDYPYLPNKVETFSLCNMVLRTPFP